MCGHVFDFLYSKLFYHSSFHWIIEQCGFSGMMVGGFGGLAYLLACLVECLEKQQRSPLVASFAATELEYSHFYNFLLCNRKCSAYELCFCDRAD